MAQTQPFHLHALCGNLGSGGADALIVILFGQGKKADAEELARQWGPAVPCAVFVGLELDLNARRMDLVALRALLSDVLDRQGQQGGQVILLGSGRAGRVAIELALLGVVPGASVITLDIPLEPVPTALTPAPGLVRMVQSGTPDDPKGERFKAVVDTLQRRQIDIHSMLLPDFEPATQRAALRAAGSFLVELVANAGRFEPASRIWP
jgi:hypothetical protein